MAIKPIRNSDDTTCVSGLDPAIDSESEAGKQGFEEYMRVCATEPHRWRELLKAKDGEAFTVFRIGVIPSGVMAEISDQCGLGQGKVQHSTLYWKSFLASVKGIEGDGWDKAPTIKVDGVDYVDPAFLRKTFVKSLRLVAQNVGSIAWSWNMFTEGDAKN